jgi:hypothetical protein
MDDDYSHLSIRFLYSLFPESNLIISCITSEEALLPIETTESNQHYPMYNLQILVYSYISPVENVLILIPGQASNITALKDATAKTSKQDIIG